MRQLTDSQRRTEQIALGLGWFSIGLGLAELAAPRALARLIGVPPDRRTLALLQAYGAREIGSGVAILRDPDNATRVWARVGGDLIDLASLGGAWQSDHTDRTRLALTAAAVLGVTVVDVLCAQQLGRANSPAASRDAWVRATASVTINQPIERVYDFWRNVENLPRFMRHLESVTPIGHGRSRWRATAPAGMSVEWEAELVEEREQERISWRSLPESGVDNRGTVRFQRAPGARGTEVHVELEYVPPAGAVGRTAALLFGEEPGQQIRDDLHRFKQLLETGEIARSDGPGLWRPAQPAPADREASARTGVTS